MANIHFIKQGDRRPYLKAQLIYKDEEGNIEGYPDLSVAESIKFSMLNKVTGLLKVAEGTNVVILGDPTLANVEYQFQDGDTSDFGNFKGEFSVDWGGGETETFPNDEEGFPVKITRQLSPRT